jgi:hypothetical protein
VATEPPEAEREALASLIYVQAREQRAEKVEKGCRIFLALKGSSKG